jgi:hypothetical protein
MVRLSWLSSASSAAVAGRKSAPFVSFESLNPLSEAGSDTRDHFVHVKVRCLGVLDEPL